MKKVLIIDNDDYICQILIKRLCQKEYSVIIVNNSDNALSIIKYERPNIIVFDIMLSKNGYSVYNQIRKNFSAPIILLTALSNVKERVIGLELGADDYLVKPFAPKELEARIASLLRRIYPANSQKFCQIGDLVIDEYQQTVAKNGNFIKLTDMEFKLLHLLITKAGENLTRAFILNTIWGYVPDRYSEIRVVDIYISRLRSKIEENPAKPNLILTVRGIGYRFQSLKD
jgi:OmpR family response regulator RpaB